MTYIDMFGTERHSTHCTCDKCVVDCEYGWKCMALGKEHVCYRKSTHPGRHLCRCGASRAKEKGQVA